MIKELKNLTEKQDKEFDEMTKPNGVYLFTCKEDLLSFIAKIRKETAEYVADRIIEGNKLFFVDGEGAKHWENGYNIRIKEEKEIKNKILKEL